MECAQCSEPIRLGKIEYEGNVYHNGCFVCTACKGSLKDRKIEKLDQGLFHAQCYEQIKDDICAKCGKMVTENAMDLKGKCYHEECLACKVCKKSISGKKFFFEEGEFYHESCYKSLHTLTCGLCNFEIDGTDVKFVTYFEKFIHHECFVCSKCGKQLSTAEKFRDVKTTVKGALICMACSESSGRKTTKPRFANSRFANFNA